MPILEDGVRSWPTWLSAKSLRNRPQELMRMLETLDSRCWPLLTQLRKPRSSMLKSPTEDLRWWLSSACFSRRRKGSVRVLFPYNSARQETPQRLWLRERRVLQKESQISLNLHGMFWDHENYVLPGLLSAHNRFDWSMFLSCCFISTHPCQWGEL